MSLPPVLFRPTTAVLRQFAALAALLLAVLAVRQYVHGHMVAACIFGGLTLLVGLLGLRAPLALRPVFVGLIGLSYPLNWLVTHLVLACLFYGVFTPVGLVFRLLGRDILGRRFRPDRDTYWLSRPATDDTRGYFRTG
jgi:hypothetical protein